jgi:biotin transport system ATP-binding protein
MDGIVLQDVNVDLGGKRVLSGLSLHLDAPRIGILGRNGSGKSTLLRLMAGLIAPSSGTVRVAGLDPARERKAMLDKIGILFQNPDHQILFPTVEEELAFGLMQQGETQSAAMAAAHACLNAERRSDWAKTPVSTLSHGQKQWLCLQAVLLMQPGTLLLDEPFAALDMPTEARLRRQLDALPQRLITIAHRPDDLAGCDKVLWLEAGRLAGFGAPALVLPEFTAAMAALGAQDAP